MEAIHIFRDETTNRKLSSKTISTGSDKDTSKEIETGFMGGVNGAKKQLGEDLTKTFVNAPLNQMTGGLYREGKKMYSILTAKTVTASAVAGGITAIAFKALEIGVQKIQERIDRLESEANEQNNSENLLIRAGGMNVSNASKTRNKFGRTVYKYDRS